MKLLHIIFLTVLIIFSIEYAESAKAAGKVNYVFIQNADKAILTPVKNTVNTYQLTLIKVHPYINYFSERPYRMSGMMPTAQFFKNWNVGKDSFAKDTPNVSVSGIRLHGSDGNQIGDYLLALSSPNYNAANNTMTYEAKLLTRKEVTLQKSVELKNVVIFLDDGWCPSCCCGV